MQTKALKKNFTNSHSLFRGMSFVYFHFAKESRIFTYSKQQKMKTNPVAKYFTTLSIGAEDFGYVVLIYIFYIITIH